MMKAVLFCVSLLTPLQSIWLCSCCAHLPEPALRLQICFLFLPTWTSPGLMVICWKAPYLRLELCFTNNNVSPQIYYKE